MKVILTEDIDTLGACGQTVEVKAGYARNFLIPRNLAIPASKGNLRAVDHLKTQKDLRDKKQRKEAEKLRDELEKLSLTAEVMTGEEDKVFGSVTNHNIADLIEQNGHTIDRRLILLEEPIKALGLYTIHIKLAKDVTAAVKLQVVKKES
ncbi:MAG: 50S ribosomal protein L9 [candidate division Zixibacteria bacterium]|nr:50S ribosomal protein L9 [candidate division Zixibacteria bacterium]